MVILGSQKNRWLLILSIIGLVVLFIVPYMIDFGSIAFNIIFSYGVFFEIYKQDTFTRYFSLPVSGFSPNNLYITLSSIFSILGAILIIIGGIFHFKDRFAHIRRYVLLVFSGGFLGFMGTMFFIPFGLDVQANTFTFTGNHSIAFEWYFAGIYPIAVYFFGLALWGFIRIFHPPAQTSDESALRLSTLATHRQNITRIQKSFDSIPLQMFRRILDINSQEDLDSLRKLLPPNLQYSIVGNDAVFLKETVSKMVDPSTLVRATRKDVCFYCDSVITLDDEICPSCHRAKLICAICKLPIETTDEIGQCPHCESISHLMHLKTWIEIRMKCPHCLQNLTPSDYKTITREDILQRSEPPTEISN